jgi:hypothetical protein
MRMLDLFQQGQGSSVPTRPAWTHGCCSASRAAPGIAELEREFMYMQPIEQAQDPDLRLSVVAMQRAALRARELAYKTGTQLVVSLDGVVQFLEPDAPEFETLLVQQTPAPYGEKR